MTPEEILQYWINLSDNDLAVAETLAKNRHNIYACFMCQQAVEKMFKGYYANTKNDTPPFRHELKFLAQKTGLYDLLDEVQKSFIVKLSPFNIEARYPDYQNKIAQNLTDEDTKNIFDQTKEFVQWIKQKILS